jgi:hypothetical protein
VVTNNDKGVTVTHIPAKYRQDELPTVMEPIR